MGVIFIKIPIHSDRVAVKNFLQELKEVLCADDFDVDKNLILVKSSRDDVKYSTNYAMLDLNYGAEDVVERLKELTLEEYVETLMDKDDDKPPLLFVFGKNINTHQIYIKLKIKGEKPRKVLCLSFHYAKYEMLFPYA